MTPPMDDPEDENTTRRTKGDSEGEAGAGSGLSRMLTTKKVAQVKGDHRHLVDNGLVEALVEFCSAGLMRASANLTVVWDKSFAIVNQFLTFCGKELPKIAQNLKQTATRDTRGLQQKKPPGGFGVNLGPKGPTE